MDDDVLEHNRFLKDFHFFAVSVKATLRRSYMSLSPSHDEHGFDEIFTLIAINDMDTLDDPFSIVKHLLSLQSISEHDIAYHPLGPILVSATYLYRHKKSLSDNDAELAWSYVTDALYWSGYVTSGRSLAEFRGLTESDLSSDELMDLQNHAAKKVASEQGKKHREKQLTGWAKVKQYAQNLSFQRNPLDGWESLADAVRAIEDDVIAFAKTEGITMAKQEDRNRTIEKYLSEPGVANHFNLNKTKNK